MSARNLHTTETTLVNGDKHGTKLRSTAARILSATSNLWPTTRTTVVDSHYSNRTGESRSMQNVTELTAAQLHIFVGIFITLVCIFIQQTLTVPITCNFCKLHLSALATALLECQTIMPYACLLHFY